MDRCRHPVSPLSARGPRRGRHPARRYDERQRRQFQIQPGVFQGGRGWPLLRGGRGPRIRGRHLHTGGGRGDRRHVARTPGVHAAMCTRGRRCRAVGTASRKRTTSTTTPRAGSGRGAASRIGRHCGTSRRSAEPSILPRRTRRRRCPGLPDSRRQWDLAGRTAGDGARQVVRRDRQRHVAVGCAGADTRCIGQDCAPRRCSAQRRTVRSRIPSAVTVSPRSCSSREASGRSSTPRCPCAQSHCGECVRPPESRVDGCRGTARIR